MPLPDFGAIGQAASANAGQHVRSVQAALDAARRLGHPLDAPVVGRGDSAADVASESTVARRTNNGRTLQRTSSFDDLIKRASAREGVDPALVKAVVQAESGGNPQAVSASGAKGLMQLMDGTARSLGVANSFDPVQNVAGGVKYLKELLGKYGGDTSRALAAYNAGPGAVDAHGGVPPYAETRGYVQRVLQLRDQLRPESRLEGQSRPDGR